MAKTVRDVMTPSVRTVKTDQPLTEAARVMKEEDVGSVPIVDNGHLVGIVTDRDIVTRVVAEHRDPDTVRAGEVASHDLVTVEPDQKLDEAADMMAQHQVRRLPVVEGDRLVGMLSQADVASETSGKKSGDMLGQISEPSATDRA
jgi:CBS domain-containing protein